MFGWWYEQNDAGIAGLEITDKYGLAGACCDAWSAPVGDAFKAYAEGKLVHVTKQQAIEA
ncbi:MAG: hypothetical protein CM15mP49_06650 [Actinomycetota bacterium]|nr:MAG: hypothetical protein CM15mP49_06650 [Actinomycetota bacterium]